MNEDNIVSRIREFMETSGLSSSQFADMCDVPRPSISQLLSGRNKKISDVLIAQIHKAYPELSIMWLLFGEGSMFGAAACEGSSAGSGMQTNGELTFEDSKNAGDSSMSLNQSNLSALNGGVGVGQSIGNLGVNSDLKMLEMQREIDKMRKNPRKVVQITIYYDDSTFETFVPGR